uniref:Uncharacterized protein n=1 Tax=Moorena producens (strain JHB) TaxID=1454205 RepID=A0A1D9G3U1_MOOP1
MSDPIINLTNPKILLIIFSYFLGFFIDDVLTKIRSSMSNQDALLYMDLDLIIAEKNPITVDNTP